MSRRFELVELVLEKCSNRLQSVIAVGKDKLWHLFMAEIGPAGRKGLGGWTAHSQVAHAVSQSPAGPYKRKALVA